MNNTVIRYTDFIPPHFFGLFNDFMEERHSNYWLAGGRASLKSSVASELIILGLMSHPDTHAIITRKHKVDLHNTVYSQYIKSIHILGVAHLFNIPKTDQGAPPITYKPTGQKIYFAGLDDPDGIKSITPPFGYLKYSHHEEIHQLPGMEKLRSANQSIRRGSSERFITFYTYNPPRSINNWVNIEMKELAKLDSWFVMLSTWEMLPDELAYKWLGPDWIQDALDTKERDPDTYKHEYLGIPVGYGTGVFKNLQIRPITDDEIKTFDNVEGGIDYGFADDPAAWVRSHFDRRKRILYIFDEVYGKGMLNRQLARAVLEHVPNINDLYEYTTCDSAEKKSTADLKEEGLYRARNAIKGPGSVERGTKWLQELEAIVIDDVRCPNSAREFAGAEFEVDKDGNVLRRVADHDNHTIDATRYRCESEMKKKAGWE